jgi:hypothetical protein
MIPVFAGIGTVVIGVLLGVGMYATIDKDSK